MRLIGILALLLALPGAGCSSLGPVERAPAGEAAPRFPKPRPAPPSPPSSAPIALAEAGVGPPLELSVRPDRTSLPPGAPLTLAVAIEVRARPLRLGRPPLDISLVFDKSGSMGERGKLVHTLEAARLLIENLTERDTVSIVAFDSEVVVLDRQQPATQKLFLAHWLDEIEAGGATNLSGGLLAGIAEVRRGRRSGAVGRVILLTDGLANRGVVAPEELWAIAASAREAGISVSTIGVGDEFDERVLAGLAEAGGGRYTYVSEAEAIPGAVAGEVDGLLPVIAQNVRLSIETVPGVEPLEPPAPEEPAREGPARPAGGRASPDEVLLGDLVPGERRTVLLSVALAPREGPAPAAPILRAAVSYQNPRAAGAPARVEQTLAVPVAASAAQSAATTDATVLGAARLAEALDLVYLAIESRDRTAAERARRMIESSRAELDALARHGESGTVREHAQLLAHYGEEIDRLAAGGALHGHDGQEDALELAKKDLHYRRYLLLHHRPGAGLERHP